MRSRFPSIKSLLTVQFVVITVSAQPITAAEKLLSAKAAPTFVTDVAPILQAHCTRCHQSGGIASFAQFTSYAAVRPWAKAIKQMVALRQMPPWPADPENSLKFRNDARLSGENIATLLAWVDAGSPQGQGAGSLPRPSTANDWTDAEGRPPDLVISMTREAQIPANGDIPYLRFLVKLPITEDKWIVACQARPGNASVVHHMAITEMELPEGVSPADVEALQLLARKMGAATEASVLKPVVTTLANPHVFDMLAIYTPGVALEKYQNDSGKLLKAGKNSYIDFNIHYSANGKASTDRSQVAFWFRETPPKHQIYRVPMSAETIIANGKELLTDAPGVKAEGTQMVIPPIPPGASNYQLIGITAFTEPVTIYQLHPHAHLRAKDFKYQVVYPDGREQTLLTVPNYDFRWQLEYELESPLRLPAGSKMVVTAHYDNSPNNQEVYFRNQNQSTDEMFSPFVQYSEDFESPNEKRLPIMETVGCLVPPAHDEGWVLAQATAPVPSKGEAANSGDILKAARSQLGVQEFHLIGLSAFKPSKHQGEVVAVIGVLSPVGERHLNVTSLQRIAEHCTAAQ